MKNQKILRPWPPLLTLDGAADYVGVSRRVIEAWLKEGKLQPHELPGIRGRDRLEKTVIERGELERLVGIRPGGNGA
jgi:excisionase family DNA binding protein